MLIYIYLAKQERIYLAWILPCKEKKRPKTKTVSLHIDVSFKHCIHSQTVVLNNTFQVVP